MSQTIKQLCAHTIPLVGKHLIEASAGTGKTYNITRLYLRFLLERKLNVEQILVMTFTKDATEELRGRIDNSIREAINHWDELVEKEEYFQHLAQKITKNEALTLLKKALLYLDEAAIYTIHGFCKRVLSQHAFATGMTFNAVMESDCQELVVEATQDFYRHLAKEAPENFALLAHFWQTPEQFVTQFSTAIKQTTQVEVLSVDYFVERFMQQAQVAKAALASNKEFLFTHLVDKHKDRIKRQQEYLALFDWLNAVLVDIENAKASMPNAFFNGTRYSRKKEKEALNAIFAPLKALQKQHKNLAQNREKAAAFAIVHQGVLAIRQALFDKKQQLNQLSFDDLITKLAQALDHDVKQQLAQTLYEQYPVALVDEFQDTDPQQFNILEKIYFQQEAAALYLIGDPKQAIYAFRGGDVFAYLSARKHCEYQWLMETNWRSSALMIKGYNRLFWGNDLSASAQDVFGYDIPYSQVKVSPKGAQLIPLDKHFKALQFVHFNEIDQQNNKASKQSLRPAMANWCAQEITRLLNQDEQKLAAKDIAILVRDGSEAAEIKKALLAQELSSVYLSDRENLLKTKEADQLMTILKGILFVENERLFSAALANPLLGFTAKQFYQCQQDQQQWQHLKFAFAALREQWQQKSFISMALNLLHQRFVIPESEKDRILTNLIHLFELLQQASQHHQDGQALLFWFEQQIKQESPAIETQLRLESDESLIKIVTQHGSKGLEYPVVFIPFATRHKDPLQFGNKAVSLISYHDSQGQLKLSLDASDDAKQAMQNEAYAETIRLLYVAITRAEQRCYILTANFDKKENSPLGRTLKWDKDVDIISTLTALSIQQNDAIGFTVIDVCEEKIISKQNHPKIIPTAVNEPVKVANFTGKIERNWWLSSFTSLSKNIRHSRVSSPDRDQALDIDIADENQQSPYLRFNLAKGAHTGNLLHNILEKTDFSAANWQETLAKPLAHYGDLLAHRSNTMATDDQPKQQADLIAWLDEIIKTPLDLEKKLSLSQLSFSQTLRESEFYFPMEQAKASQLTQLLVEHRQNSAHKTDTQQLHLPHYQKLHGMMHGFIDLIFCYQGKFYLADYKSTHLGDHFNDYSVSQLASNIEKNHYDLQYLIYALALHRYLQQRLENYSVNAHFGGVYYLYLRGMTTDPAYHGSGVFYREIKEDELNRLDNIFTGTAGISDEK